MTAFPTLDYLDYAVAKACDCVAAGNLAREQDKTVDVPARHNPLVVVGPSGCGKSQWLKNFFHLWRKRSTEKAGLWDGLALGAEIAAADEADTLDRWRSRFVSLPLVLIDGIDRVADSHSQQLLPFLFDAAASAGKQWVVTLRAHPHVCTTIQSALATRLSGGLVIALPRPAFKQHSHPARGLGSLRLRQPKAVLRRVIATTALHYGLTPDDLTGPSRHRATAHARAMAMVLARQLTGQSLLAIGNAFGNRDHTTVMHSLRVVHKRLGNDCGVACDMDQLLRRLA